MKKKPLQQIAEPSAREPLAEAAGMTIQVRSGGQFLIDPETPAEAEQTPAKAAPANNEEGTDDAHT